MHEQLLGYLLGALDAEEQREVEARLQVDPLWRSELAHLKNHLHPLHADQEHYQAPSGLAERACAAVFEQQSGEISLAQGALQRELTGGRSRWRLADLVVAGGICAAAILLFFPVIAHSRFAAELAQCQNNLRELGIALVGYDERHQQMPFPSKELGAPLVGMYAPILVNDGYVNDPSFFICPQSTLAANRANFHVPTRDELRDRANFPPAMKHTLGGSYGYSLGYLTDGVYRPMRNLHRALFAVMSDAPSKNLAEFRSANHRGQGQNVLFENGRVQYLVSVIGGDRQDNLFLSDRGRIEPGRNPDDAVIACSDTLVTDLIDQ